MGRGGGRGGMGTGAPSSPVKQRGLYTEFLGEVTPGLRQVCVCVCVCVCACVCARARVCRSARG